MAKDLTKMSVQELEAFKKTLQQQNMLIGAVGGIAGIVYANKTGGGFWRYVGYWILGGMVVGTLPRLFYFIPKENEVDAMISQKMFTSKPTSTNDKGELVSPTTSTSTSTSTSSTTNVSFDGENDLEL